MGGNCEKGFYAMSRVRLLPLVALALFGNALLIAPAVYAEDDNPVAATVNGDNVYVSEVEDLVGSLSRQYKTAPKAELRRQVVKRLIERKLLVQAAIKQGLDKDADLLRRLEDMRQDLLQETYLTRRVDKELTEDVLRAAYEKRIAGKEGKDEVHARHILLKDEAAAKDIIKKLDDGGDFAELAKEHSTGPTGERGGDLGFFPDGSMVVPFSKAAFALEPGKYTTEPVKTQFGWHIIKVEERRAASVPSYGESVDELSNTLIGEMVDGLRRSAEVAVYADRLPGFDPVPEGDKKP
jgi:peptidyl-prolyl cis-trans isomerase C